MALEYIYRCTFPNRYPIGTVGHTDPSGRQGHYAKAACPTDAVALLIENGQCEPGEVVDVQAWGVPGLRQGQAQGRYIAPRSAKTEP